MRVPDRTFFLFGPRGVGKSTWLREVLAGALLFDLLDSSLYLEFCRSPSRLEAMVGNRSEGTWVVLDEIVKVPQLLDGVDVLPLAEFLARVATGGVF